jgi:hypothetical protein
VPERYLKFFDVANCDIKLGVCHVVAFCDHILVLGLVTKEGLNNSM